jgi:benzylsuccinate CoA-transferase BbsE subunit
METNTSKQNGKGALTPYCALDLTDEKGLLCGKLLSMMGAEVIKVEPPGGDPARNIPPFYKDIPHPEKSLYYWSYNTNKKSITLDIRTPDGQKIFKDLVKRSDFVFESFRPGYMESIGLGFEVLRQINPRIIMTSISPLGQKGPYAQYKGSDLMCTAMSGFLYLTGDEDRAPLRISVPQAYSMGATEAAATSLIAHYYRQRTGTGQHVDVSIRDSMVKATINSPIWFEHYGKLIKRRGSFWGIRGSAIKVFWPLADGWVSFTLTGAKFGARTNHQLVDWADTVGMADDIMKNVDWVNLDMETADRGLIRHLEDRIEAFFKTRKKEEIIPQALSRKIMMAPVNTIADIAADPHLEDREFWEEVEHPELGATIRYPGAFIKASASPCVRTTRAPLIGEHNSEIYLDKLAMTREQFVALKAAHVI